MSVAMRAAAGLALVIAAAACSGAPADDAPPQPKPAMRTVQLGWDAPAKLPERYRFFVDGRLVTEIEPPPVDGSCRCLKHSLSVPVGRHTVSVVAFQAGEESAQTTITVE